MKNSEIAELLYEIADILEMQNVDFKPVAYRKAARGVEMAEMQASDMYALGGVKAIRQIPGVGEKIAEKIVELVTTGKLEYYLELKKKIPAHISKLMEVPGMGPKRIRLLHEKLKVADIDSLESAAKEHKISKIEGFGEKSERDILKGIETFRKGTKRMLLWNALEVAREFVRELRKIKEVEKVEIAGSLRRRKESIGDIDILVSSEDAGKVMDFFVGLKMVASVIAKGKTKSSVVLESGVQVDLRVVDKDSFGAALQYFTGSKDHNVALRELAIKKGLKVNEYGVFRKKDNVKIAGETEAGVYKAVGVPMAEPEMRENTGELQLKNALKVISYDSIRGNFHTHTKKTDGTASIEEMVSVAKNLGYEYIAITDHTKSTRIAHGLTEDEMLAHIADIRRVDRKTKGIKIFAGAEVDILPNGELDYSDETLAKLEVVIASVHSRFKSTRDEMTQRVVTALQNKHVDILGHPTGRLIDRREPYEINLSRVFEAAAKNKVHLEINAQPNRLDIKDVFIKQAKSYGLKFSISTDAHSVAEMRFMELGVAMARKGWLNEKDVVNALPLKELPRHFRRLRL